MNDMNCVKAGSDCKYPFDEIFKLEAVVNNPEMIKVKQILFLLHQKFYYYLVNCLS